MNTTQWIGWNEGLLSVIVIDPGTEGLNDGRRREGPQVDHQYVARPFRHPSRKARPYDTIPARHILLQGDIIESGLLKHATYRRTAVRMDLDQQVPPGPKQQGGLPGEDTIEMKRIRA